MPPAQYQASVGYTLPTAHSVHRHLTAAARDLRAVTGGALDLTLYPHESFDSDIGMLEQVFAGTLDFMVVTGPFLGRRVPVAAIGNMPFAFDGPGAVWRAMDGPLGAKVRAALQEAGLHAFEHVFDNGFRHLTTSGRTVRSAADVQGLAMRVVAAPLYESLWRTLGARTVSMDIAEVRQALAEGRVEAQDNPLALIEAFALHEVQSRCALTAHVWDGYWLVANGRRWQALPVPLREQVARAFSQAALAQRREQADAEDALRRRLQAAGLALDEVDRASFRASLAQAGFYEEWRARFGPAAWRALQDTSQIGH